jgi:hypothetical protein
MNRITLLLICSLAVSRTVATLAADTLQLDGWRPFAHRDETSPDFEIRREGGPHGRGALVIGHDDREHLDGAWMKTFDVAGDCHYRITAHSRTTNVANARAHTYVELLFHNANGELVQDKQIYLVTSTYSINDDWMQSGIWDLGGQMLVRATEKDSVVVAEVDLSEQYFWRANMGEFKGRLRHERPTVALPK